MSTDDLAATSPTASSPTIADADSPSPDEILTRKSVFTAKLRPMVTQKRGRKKSAESNPFSLYVLTHVTSNASVDLAISYCVLTSSVTGDSTTISAGQKLSVLAGTTLPTLCIEEQASAQASSALSRIAKWRKPKAVATCFETESKEDLELWFSWIRYILQPESNFLPVTVSTQSANTTDPYCGPALVTIREKCILAILQPSTLNLLEVVRINIITAFGNEDDDTALWLTVCPTCRAGPAHAEQSSMSTRFACKYAFQPATEEIHRQVYGLLEELCLTACGEIWRVPQHATGVCDGVDGYNVTNAMLCFHSSLCPNSRWGLPLSPELISNVVAPIICNVWQSMAVRAGYSCTTVESWVDQFDTMLVIPQPGEVPQVTASQEAIIFLTQWHRTTENDTLHQIVRLMRAQDLNFEINLLLWALFNERVQVRPDSPLDLECRQVAHSFHSAIHALNSDAISDGTDSLLAVSTDMPSSYHPEPKHMSFPALGGHLISGSGSIDGLSSMMVETGDGSLSRSVPRIASTAVTIRKNKSVKRSRSNISMRPRQSPMLHTNVMPTSRTSPNSRNSSKVSILLQTSASNATRRNYPPLPPPLPADIPSPSKSPDESAASFSSTLASLHTTSPEFVSTPPPLHPDNRPMALPPVVDSPPPQTWRNARDSPSSQASIGGRSRSPKLLWDLNLRQNSEPLPASTMSPNSPLAGQQISKSVDLCSERCSLPDPEFLRDQLADFPKAPSALSRDGLPDDVCTIHRPLAGNSFSERKRPDWVGLRSGDSNVLHQPTPIPPQDVTSSTGTMCGPGIPCPPQVIGGTVFDLGVHQPLPPKMSSEASGVPYYVNQLQSPYYQPGLPQRKHPYSTTDAPSYQLIQDKQRQYRSASHASTVPLGLQPGKAGSIAKNLPDRVAVADSSLYSAARDYRDLSDLSTSSYISHSRVPAFQGRRLRHTSSSSDARGTASSSTSSFSHPGYVEVCCHNPLDESLSDESLRSSLMIDENEWDVIDPDRDGLHRATTTRDVTTRGYAAGAMTKRSHSDVGFKSHANMDARSRDGHRFRQGMNLQLAPIPSPTDTFMSSDHAVQAPWNEPAAPSQTSVTDVTTEEYATFGLHSLDNLPSQSIRQGTVHRLAQHISEHYGNDWVCLGHELGLTFEEVNKFERDYQSVVERIYHMIQAWLEKKGEAVGTKRTLIAMLHGLHWQDSADVLANLLARQCTSHYASTPSMSMPCTPATSNPLYDNSDGGKGIGGGGYDIPFF